MNSDRISALESKLAKAKELRDYITKMKEAKALAVNSPFLTIGQSGHICYCNKNDSFYYFFGSHPNAEPTEQSKIFTILGIEFREKVVQIYDDAITKAEEAFEQFD